MNLILAILLGKAIFWLSRFLKQGGGSTAPGLYGLKIYPSLIEKLTAKIPANIIITGTNGKTTTSRMLAHFAKKENLKIIRNHTGSNLERGIASTLISDYRLPTTDYRLDLGIWELDEAAFNTVALKIKPKIVVFLNVFRDQLDRYGEIDTVVKKWGETLEKLPKETAVLVNGDDASILSLSQHFKGKVSKFGVKDYKIVGESTPIKSGSIEHKKENENLDYEAKDVKLKGLTGSSFSLFLNHKSLIVNLPLPGIYHIYDFLAAFAVGKTLSFDDKKMVSSLKNFSPAFGRVERFTFKPARNATHSVAGGPLGFKAYIFLIKNPAGATQVFETIAPQLKSTDRLLLALNDNLADGTDVSWIWDANFERLQGAPEGEGSRPQIICSGTRAYDLANRLKYAGFDVKTILIEPDLKQAFKEARKALSGRLFILPTYTAMLELQFILVKSGIKKNYWEEDN